MLYMFETCTITRTDDMFWCVDSIYNHYNYGCYEQVREKYLALKKDTKAEVVAEFEEVCF
jgi:hypothetical protein